MLPRAAHAPQPQPRSRSRSRYENIIGPCYTCRLRGLEIQLYEVVDGRFLRVSEVDVLRLARTKHAAKRPRCMFYHVNAGTPRRTIRAWFVRPSRAHDNCVMCALVPGSHPSESGDMHYSANPRRDQDVQAAARFTPFPLPPPCLHPRISSSITCLL